MSNGRTTRDMQEIDQSIRKIQAARLPDCLRELPDGVYDKNLHAVGFAGVFTQKVSSKPSDCLLINFGSYKFEMRKFAWSQDAARRKSKPASLLSAVSAFFAFFAV